MRLGVNSVWRDWKVVRLIGQGSFGDVYEIHRELFGITEKAALKVITIPKENSEIEELYSDGYDNESVTQHFRDCKDNILKEYAMMAKLKGNPNVVHCEDLETVQHSDGIGWDIYIRMELMTPLTKVLDERRLTEEEIVNVGRDICSALIKCETQGIIHRDIKPQNILVSEAGVCKLGDFGVAKIVESATGGKTKVGTYKYMAPEIYNNQPYGNTVDIYSLGLVLYWLLNERRTPFLPLPPERTTVLQDSEARARRFAGDTLPDPAHGCPELKKIVLKACAFDPKDRYASAKEMYRDLEALKNCASEETVYIFSASPNDKGKEKPVKTQTDSAIDRTDIWVNAQSLQESNSIGSTIHKFTQNKAEASEPNNDAQGRKPAQKKWLFAVIATLILLVIELFLILGQGTANKTSQVIYNSGNRFVCLDQTVYMIDSDGIFFIDGEGDKIHWLRSTSTNADAGFSTDGKSAFFVAEDWIEYYNGQTDYFKNIAVWSTQFDQIAGVWSEELYINGDGKVWACDIKTGKTRTVLNAGFVQIQDGYMLLADKRASSDTYQLTITDMFGIVLAEQIDVLAAGINNGAVYCLRVSELSDDGTYRAVLQQYKSEGVSDLNEFSNVSTAAFTDTYSGMLRIDKNLEGKSVTQYYNLHDGIAMPEELPLDAEDCWLDSLTDTTTQKEYILAKKIGNNVTSKVFLYEDGNITPVAYLDDIYVHMIVDGTLMCSPANGSVTKCETFWIPCTDESTVFSNEVYDINMDLCRSVSYDEAGRVVSFQEFKWNDSGDTVIWDRTTDYNEEGEILRYTETDFSENGIPLSASMYNKNGQFMAPRDKYSEITYDVSGDPIKYTGYDDSRNILYYQINEYDSDKHWTKNTWYNADGSIEYTAIITTDSYGYLTEAKYYDENEEYYMKAKRTYSEEIYVDTYYTLDDQLFMRQYFDFNNHLTREVIYDGYGNITSDKSF